MASKTQNLVKQTDPSGKLLNDLRTLSTDARQEVARFVNSALVMLYWKVGQHIQEDVLKERRAEYGEQILPTLCAKLVAEFGPGFNEKSLRRMVQFTEVFLQERIVATLSRQLSWSHFGEIILLNDERRVLAFRV